MGGFFQLRKGGFFSCYRFVEFRRAPPGAEDKIVRFFVRTSLISQLLLRRARRIAGLQVRLGSHRVLLLAVSGVVPAFNSTGAKPDGNRSSRNFFARRRPSQKPKPEPAS
jgi:hypothetical protein